MKRQNIPWFHPDYNDRLPIVIIPTRFRNIYPFNTAVTMDVIREAFFQTGTCSIKDYFSENSWGRYNLQEGAIASSSPNFVGEEGNPVMLPYSGAIGNISWRYHENIPGDKRKWIQPEFPVTLSSGQYFDNTDRNGTRQ